MGWDRYDSPAALAALNDLYRHELRLMMNLFQPSVKLGRKTRIGARLHRTYDRPQTPLDRLLASGTGNAQQLRALQRLRARHWNNDWLFTRPPVRCAPVGAPVRT